MATVAELEKRVAALEAEVQAVRLALHPTATPDNSIPGFGVIGRFADDPTFEEAMRLGRVGEAGPAE